MLNQQLMQRAVVACSAHLASILRDDPDTPVEVLKETAHRNLSQMEDLEGIPITTADVDRAVRIARIRYCQREYQRNAK